MKTYTAIATIAVMLALGLHASAETEISMQMKSITPAEGDDWKSAGGSEFQVRFRDSDRVALAGSVGFETWDAVEEYVDETDGDDEYRSVVNGSCSVLPVGISLLYSYGFDEPYGDAWSVHFLFEAGIRYAFVDSDVYSEVTLVREGDQKLYADTIEIEDIWLAKLSASIELRMSESSALEFGLGYQRNLSAPKESWLGESIGSSSFNGATTHIGFTFAF